MSQAEPTFFRCTLLFPYRVDRIRGRLGAVLGIALLALGAAELRAQPLGTVAVSAQSNIFAAGSASPASFGGGALPAGIDLPGAAGSSLTFAVSGGPISCCGGGGAHGGDGGNGLATAIFGSGGISGLRHQTRSLFLVGVFLGPSAPSGNAPADLSYYSPLDTTLPPPNVLSDRTPEVAPLLRQAFFLGDGLEDVGRKQRIRVPSGATRLFLGFADALNLGDPRFTTPSPAVPCCYNDNTGSLMVAVTREICATAAFPSSCSVTCQRTIQEADAISQRTMAGAESLSRNDYLILFAAAECRTGVPAWLLKAFSFSEAFGRQYEDLTPRQFNEPCKQSWNQSVQGWSYPVLFGNYYGQNQPLPAFNAPAPFLCAQSGNQCSCQPATAFPQSIQRPGPPPAPCANQVPNPQSDPQWAQLWPYLSHPVLGDDSQPDPANRSFGIGVMQTTFFVRDVLLPTASPRLSFTHLCFTPSNSPDIYMRGGAPGNGFVNLEPLHTMERVIKDPQFNILLAAQLILYKAEFAQGGGPRPDVQLVTSKVDSPPYGPILTLGPSGPQSEEEWAFQGGQAKRIPDCKGPCAGASNPNLCFTECSQQYLLRVLRYTNGSIPGLNDAACLAASPNRSNEAGCLAPQAHAFVVASPVLP